MSRFSNKVVMIAGAGSGIGRATAQRIASEGGAVFCVDLNREAVDATVSEIVSSGGKATGHDCDVSNEAAVAACFTACIDAYGSLYALINMAGILRFDDTEALQLDHWQKVVDVNLTGTMLLCRAALPHLIKSQGQYRQCGFNRSPGRATLRCRVLRDQGRRAGHDAQYCRRIRQARRTRQLCLPRRHQNRHDRRCHIPGGPWISI